MGDETVRYWVVLPKFQKLNLLQGSRLMSLKYLYNFAEEPKLLWGCRLAGQSVGSHSPLQTPLQRSKYQKLTLIIRLGLVLKSRIPGALPPHDVMLKSKGKVKIPGIFIAFIKMAQYCWVNMFLQINYEIRPISWRVAPPNFVNGTGAHGVRWRQGSAYERNAPSHLTFHRAGLTMILSWTHHLCWVVALPHALPNLRLRIRLLKCEQLDFHSRSTSFKSWLGCRLFRLRMLVVLLDLWMLISG
jgi:hypothetical protein